jgi:PAS domain S-box-containing protein
MGAARVRVLIDSLPQLLWSSRPNGECDYFSPQWTRYTGLSPEVLKGSGWMSVIHPEDLENVEQAWSQLIAGSLPYDLEYRIRRKDGVWRWFSGRASAVRDNDGVIRRWYGSATDITETVEARRQLEERVAERTRELEASLSEQAVVKASLAQAQRLETVGRLTGGVAHDFNNLLTVVIGGLDMILKAPGDSARVRRLGEAALAAGRRGERLTRQLLAFSRRQELKLEVRDVAEIVRQAEPLMRRAAGEALDLQVNCAADVGFSKLDTAQLEAALLNLVVNASDATAQGGRIRVDATQVKLAEGEVAGVSAGDYVRISVADSGSGMAPDVLERVFEPFFTTKEVGKGTGLGLAQVYGFVSQCGGGVAIDSQLDHGTTVKLFLPASDPPQPMAAPASAPPIAAWPAGARVLLVEVSSEAEGAPALRRLERGERFDLVISDIVMPGGMSGVDLARAATRARPELPFVLTTGYAGDRGAVGDDLDWPVLRKPFRAEQLAAVLRQTVVQATDRATA